VRLALRRLDAAFTIHSGARTSSVGKGARCHFRTEQANAISFPIQSDLPW